MTIKNRELSQFASLIEVFDNGQDILIAPNVDSYVGIGTSTIQYKLHVSGDTNLGGNLIIDGDIEYAGKLELGDVSVNTTGIITATAFYDPFGLELVGFDSWTTDDNLELYRLSNVGIGTTVLSQTLTVFGDISGTQIISTIAGTFLTGTSPLQVTSRKRVVNLNADYLRDGSPGGTESNDIVTVGATQNLTNKTLTSAIINTSLEFSNVSLVSPTSGNFTVQLPSISGTLLTDADGAVIGLVTTGNIQNGTILGEDIASQTITGSNIADNTITVNNLLNKTISGITLGSSLNSLVITSSYFNVPNINYNGSVDVTRTLLATPNNTANYIVARDASGDFSASQINVEFIVATGTITAQDFNSTSDINLKKNIVKIDEALESVKLIEGVKFDWIHNSQPSFGVIAQDIENIFPELVYEMSNGTKSVNYNGLVGVLIEAVKQLSDKVDELSNK